MKVTVEIIVEGKKKNEEEMDWQIREWQENIAGVSKEVVEEWALWMCRTNSATYPHSWEWKEKNNYRRTYLSPKVTVF